MFCKRYRIHHKNDYNKQGTPCIVVATKIIFFYFQCAGRSHASEERSDECGGWSESGMLDSLVFGWFQNSQKAAHIKKISRVLQKQFLIQH